MTNTSFFICLSHADRHRIQPDRTAEVHKSIGPELSTQGEFSNRNVIGESGSASGAIAVK